MTNSVIRGLSLAVLFAFAGSAYGASDQFTAIYTFECSGNQFQRSGSCAQGASPDSLVQGSDGNFYGAAQVSMEGDSAPNGGAVFSLTPGGTLKVLHTFVAGTRKNYPNGNLPGLLTQGADGKIYGETLFGGVDGCNGYCGYGVLYRVNTDGSGFQVLHKYCSEKHCADGEYGGKLVEGTDGNLYGTAGGGSNGAGIIFKVTPSTGAYEAVVNFDISTTGEGPSGLVVASDGTFYSLTDSSTSGQLLVHYTEATGELETFPLNFPLVNGLPSAGFLLTLGPNGNFYGIYEIDAESGAGVFEADPDGGNLQLFPFYNTVDGAGAPQTMILASDGNLWLDNYNGSSGYGSIDTLSPTDGSLIQNLAPFSSTAAVGAYPAELIQAADGSLWGSTYDFGKTLKSHFADGTVFSLNAGLPPR
jgi:uncharacterized repeat protein (TIGR03803 family)